MAKTMFMIVLLLIMSIGVSSAMCVPASSRATDSPNSDDYEESSKSKASGSPDTSLSACRNVTADQGTLVSMLRSQSSDIIRNMSGVFISEDISIMNGFYPGREGRSDEEVLAFGVSYARCSLDYTLDIMKEELNRPFNDSNVSARFHAVYDVMDPASPDTLISNLETLVHLDQLNGCVIPNQACSPIASLESIGRESFIAMVKTSLNNLASDLLMSLNAL